MASENGFEVDSQESNNDSQETESRTLLEY